MELVNVREASPPRVRLQVRLTAKRYSTASYPWLEERRIELIGKMLDCSLFFFIHSSNFGVGVMRKKRKLVCRDIVRGGGGEFKFFYARNNKIVFPRMRACGWRSKRKGNFMLEIFEHLFDIDSIGFDWTNDFGEFETCNSTCREWMCCTRIPVRGSCPNLSRGLGFGARGNTSAA